MSCVCIKSKNGVTENGIQIENKIFTPTVTEPQSGGLLLFKQGTMLYILLRKLLPGNAELGQQSRRVTTFSPFWLFLLGHGLLLQKKELYNDYFKDVFTRPHQAEDIYYSSFINTICVTIT